MGNLKTRVELITPEIAREYLRYNHINRKISEKTVNNYVSDIIKGEWKLNGETVVFCKSGWLYDGQHRLTAVIKSGIAVEMLVVRGVEDDCFSTLNCGKKRTAGDAFTMAQVPNANNVASLIGYYLKLKVGSFSRDRKTANISNQTILDEYNSDMNFYKNITKKAQTYYRKARLFSPSEIGGILCLLTKDKFHDIKKVETFFDDLFCGTNGTSMNSIKLLRSRIINSMISQSEKLDHKYKMMILVKTWNSYCTGRDLKCLKWDDKIEKDLFFL